MKAYYDFNNLVKKYGDELVNDNLFDASIDHLVEMLKMKPSPVSS